MEIVPNKALSLTLSLASLSVSRAFGLLACRTVTVTVTRNCFVRDNLVNSGSVPEPVVICGEKCPDLGTAGLASRYTQPGRVLATAFGTTD